MKLFMEFELEREELPNDYRFGVVSFFKAILSDKYPDYLTSVYAKTEMKGFTFSVYLPGAKITQQYTYVPLRRVSVTVSGVNSEFVLRLYNAAQKAVGKSHPLKFKQKMTLRRCRVEEHRKVEKEDMAVKFLSPLIVREHNAQNVDRYLVYDEPNFNKQLNLTLNRLCENLGLPPPTREVTLTPIRPKTTVVRSDGLMFKVNIGLYRLQGDLRDINLLYRSGMGSKCSLGFGMFEVVEVSL